MGNMDRITAPDATDATRRERDSLFLLARVRIGDEAAAREVRVRNLSAGGLMAEIDRPLATGTALTVELRGIGEVTGTVAWCTAGRVGVALDTAIDPKKARKPVVARPESKTTFQAKAPGSR